MLDKSIKYYDVIMKRGINTYIPNPLLPHEFIFSFFKLGDEQSWAEIETSVGEFDDVNYALKYFEENYIINLDMLEQRCLFVENREGIKVATITNWWNYTKLRRDPYGYIGWQSVHNIKALVLEKQLYLKQ